MDSSTNNKNAIKLTGLRTLLVSIPYIGGAIIELGFEHRARIKSERVYSFFEELQAYFKSIKEEEINEDFIKSNQFTDLFENIIHKVSLTDDVKKRERFKQLLIGTTVPNAKIDQFEIFFELTSTLNENQIILLKKFFKAKPLIEDLEKQVSILDDKLQDSFSKVNALKIKAENGTIKQDESILAQIKESETIQSAKTLVENKVKELMSVNRNDLIGISDVDLNIIVDDLLGKRLLLDVSSIQLGQKGNSYERMMISPLGNYYIEFLLGKLILI